MKIVTVFLYESERYPDYALASESRNDLAIFIPARKFRWVRRVCEEYDRVQEYLAEAVEKRGISFPPMTK